MEERFLLVGAGGIGCEILKNLVLMDFNHIDVVDMDTIELSNLNRQFLFKRKHVGQSKSVVAVNTVLDSFPDRDVKALVLDVTSCSVDFFAKYSLVFNALDNKKARNYVNMMCVAANLPLVESGSAGYLGQVCPILPGRTECYDCNPKPAAKSYPGCTIRNTPSEFIHCVVWAKALFGQLFGEIDDLGEDNEVSPETTSEEDSDDRVMKTFTTRQWAQQYEYDPQKIFRKVFNDDINILLSMSNLWIKRTAPTPLKIDVADLCGDDSATLRENVVEDMRVPSGVSDLAPIFFTSVKRLAERHPLSFDKDDPDSLDFVYASANLRAGAFHIPMANRFEVKSKAGNIIPAVASTNAIVAALAVYQGCSIMERRKAYCVFVKPMQLMPMPCQRPNPACFVCGGELGLSAELNVFDCSLLDLRTFLSERFSASEIDLILGDGRMLPEELPHTSRPLADFGIGFGGASVMTVETERDDRFQLIVSHNDDIKGNEISLRQTRGVKRKLKPDSDPFDGL